MNAKILAPLALVAALLGTASSASAAWVYFGPVYRPVPVYEPVPVYRPVPVAYQPYAAADRLQGRVTAFNLFDMTLAVGGNLIPVRLHQGTVINPTGLTLQPGMVVRIGGYFQPNGAFHANWINLM